MDKTTDEPFDAQPLVSVELDGTPIMSGVASAAQAARSLVGLRLSALGLVPGQDRLLLVLEREGRCTVSKVANHLNIRPSTVSKTADRLCDRGLLFRTRDTVDGRLTYVELTVEGLHICNDIRAAHQTSEDELRSRLGGDQAVEIARTLAVLNDALNKQLRKHR